MLIIISWTGLTREWKKTLEEIRQEAPQQIKNSDKHSYSLMSKMKERGFPVEWVSLPKHVMNEVWERVSLHSLSLAYQFGISQSLINCKKMGNFEREERFRKSVLRWFSLSSMQSFRKMQQVLLFLATPFHFSTTGGGLILSFSLQILHTKTSLSFVSILKVTKVFLSILMCFKLPKSGLKFGFPPESSSYVMTVCFGIYVKGKEREEE
jgi:hypothetical protein